MVPSCLLMCVLEAGWYDKLCMHVGACVHECVCVSVYVCVCVCVCVCYRECMTLTPGKLQPV